MARSAIRGKARSIRDLVNEKKTPFAVVRKRPNELQGLFKASHSLRNVAGVDLPAKVGVVRRSHEDQQRYVAVDLANVRGRNIDSAALIQMARASAASVIVLRDTSGRSAVGRARLDRLVKEIGRSNMRLVVQTSSRTSNARLSALFQGTPPNSGAGRGRRGGSGGGGHDGRDRGGDRGGGSGGRGPDPAKDDGRPVRHVNTMVVAAGTETPVPDRPLEPRTQYAVLVNIGRAVKHSLLSDLDGRWPGSKLPSGALRLRAVLQLEGTASPLVASFTLPERGASFACDCPIVGDTHAVDCQHRTWVRLAFVTPDAPATLRGQLVIYYEVVAVHVQELELPVGGEQDGPRAALVYRLTRSFEDMTYLKDRTASIVVATNSSRVLINGVSFAASPFSVDNGTADAAAVAARVSLYTAHFEVIKRKEINRYLPGGNCHSVEQYTRDLIRLAQVGTKLYNAVFEHSSQQVQRALPELIRHEAQRGTPAVLSVAQTGAISPAADLVPWASIYDLPIDPDADDEEYEFCRSVEEFGPGGNQPPVPAHCPHSDDSGHQDMICPFGFWGMSCVIELPPATERGVRDFVSDRAVPVAVEAAVDTGLNSALRSKHDHRLQELAAANHASARMHDIPDRNRLRELLSGETMDIAYLYSHGSVDKEVTGLSAGTKLTFGKAKVTADTIINWSRNRAAWPPPHWDERRPLVVLNGCHTTEKVSRMLAGFVPAFVRSAGASGVVGTETAIDQDVANVAGELLIEQLLGGATVGAAIRAMRWHLLAKGNVMGLTYTPHCLAGLRMRAGSSGRSRS